MRSGLIAQKLGMSRLFSEEGAHVPGERRRRARVRAASGIAVAPDLIAQITALQ